jgi:hypothetical protein
MTNSLINNQYKDTPEEFATYTNMIGQVVVKRSNKPFKSKSKENTIKGITTNEQTQRIAFTFEEDDSNVECFR